MYLDRCIGSLICQSIEDLDILVINDGSSDNTSRIAHSWESRYPSSIRAIDKPNGHQGSCINVDISLAKGKYFKMLDGDDLFDTRVLENYIHTLPRFDADMVITGHTICHTPPRNHCTCKGKMWPDVHAERLRFSCLGDDTMPWYARNNLQDLDPQRQSCNLDGKLFIQ